MPEERSDEKTEPATPRRRQEARERGHVARSADLSSAAVLLGAVLALEFFGGDFVGGLTSGLTGVLERLAEIDGDRQNLLLHYGGALSGALLGMMPFLSVVVVVALGINLLQVGFLFTAETLQLRPERLDPMEGIKRIFSRRALIRLITGLLKISAMAAVVTWTVWGERNHLLGLAGRPLDEMLAYGVDAMLLLALRAVFVLLLLAILEFGYQRWQYDQDLRMSRSEVREEMKRYEGDPKIRERRRAIQRQLALQRMMQRVPKATVVITNPTHVAVALEYRQSEMDAPVVVAKGAEFLAQRIRETAMEHAVPIVERPDLARALYRMADVGQTVPVDLYQAVAEVLAYVYRLRGLAATAA